MFIGGACLFTHGLLNRWTSHWLFRGAKMYGWGGGAWDPNYDPRADFLDHNFLSSKNSGLDLSNEGSNFTLSLLEVVH